jgi:hypothetical protein
LVLLTATTVSVGAFVLGASERVAACSCATFTEDEALDASDAAFAGTLVEVITPSGDTYGSADPERFVFDVDEVYKGDVFARQSIVTARDGASCGLEISGPGPFLVFARETDSVVSGAVDGELYSSLCSGTRPLVSDAIPASFGTGSAPRSGASPIGANGTESSTVQNALIAGMVAVIGAGSVFAIGRRKKRAAS